MRTLREHGIPVGTNYPPLSGIQDKLARQWGDEVINFWTNTERDLILQACDLIEAVME